MEAFAPKLRRCALPRGVFSSGRGRAELGTTPPGRVRCGHVTNGADKAAHALTLRHQGARLITARLAGPSLTGGRAGRFNNSAARTRKQFNSIWQVRKLTVVFERVESAAQRVSQMSYTQRTPVDHRTNWPGFRCQGG